MAFSYVFYFQLLIIMLSALTARVCVSLWGHSGEGKPPVFGDFEAQRHWMEITANLPTEQWYTESKDNRLQYWGLDYPPLTAYHMMINGKIAQYVNSSMVALKESQGLEDPGLKFFMRMTVLAMDVLLFLPAAAAYFIMQQSESEDNDILTFILVLVAYPGLILIDHGHFQYNNVSLGLLVLATLSINEGNDFIAAFLFCCAVNYKQMELYHSLPFFAYLLGSCIKAEVSKGVFKLVMLSLIVLGTFATIWSPFLNHEETSVAVVQRLFPIKRGLYEDKVASFWCSISVIVKFKDLIFPSDMAFICLLVTSLLSLPSFLYLLKNPTLKSFHYALINSSLIFFMFSFHVHEKSILLATIPSCLVVKSDPLNVFWFLLISVFSMLPLLIKDGLLIPTIATVWLFWITVSHFLRPTSTASPDVQKIFEFSIMVAVCIAVATVLIPPPQRYPDIFPLVIAIYSFLHFVYFAVNFHMRQFGIKFYFQDSSSTRVGFSKSDSSISWVSSHESVIKPKTKRVHY
ncbi:unnamed protein product [Candidula unifasciata]|uniref:Alpha-1,3-glucosyltransferase n=1 Tax=Candidula unifasciata TaxID=100452 RepID=A0A8S3YXA9_9EUPU|nr:unnamed protein product [Candidula unifasciata]